MLILKDIKEWGFQKSLLFFTLFYMYPGTIAIPDYLGSMDKSMHILAETQLQKLVVKSLVYISFVQLQCLNTNSGTPCLLSHFDNHNFPGRIITENTGTVLGYRFVINRGRGSSFRIT